MDRFIINESGFPKDRPTLKLFQEQFTTPIDHILGLMPNTMVLEGCEIVDLGGGYMSVSAGLLMHNGKIFTLEAYSGPNNNNVSYFENTVQASFNIGTQASPVYDDRDFKIARTAKIGSLGGDPGYIGRQSLDLWRRDQKLMPFLRRGTTAVGSFALRTVVDLPISITFAEVSTENYVVVGSFKPIDPLVAFTEPFVWTTKNRTTTSFDLIVKTITMPTPPLYFSWILLTLS